jgi:C-terminal processing protease CtpA/Prc
MRAEEAFFHIPMNEQEYKDYIFYETDNYSYIAINNMSNSYGDEIKEKLGKLRSDNVIIDLRENYGGNTEYAAKYIYPSIFSEDIVETSYWYMPNSEANQRITTDWQTNNAQFQRGERTPIQN